MIVSRAVPELRQGLAALRARGPVALVPTMGALHEGHLSLVSLARKEAATVIVSIFVNPLQFGPGEDFEKYPRALPRDLELVRRAGVDAAFCPEAATFYPPNFSTSIVVGRVSDGQEGAARPGHFSGVATVVAKLFHAALPDIAIFGRKDLQQAAVIRRMIRDLDFPVRLVVASVSREPDGLARSSRNAYLSAEDRRRAAIFPKTLAQGAERLRRGESAAEVEGNVRHVLEESGFGVDYVELVDSETIERLAALQSGAALAAAVRLGGVRLIDNVLLE